MATFEAKLLVVSDTPHQPAGFKFPRREIGKQHRSFQPIWFSKWKWLHYSESDDKVFCHTCVKAVRDFKRSSKNAEEAFLTRGYNNWKAATDAFRKHESSDCHAQSVEKPYTLPSTTKDIGETLSTLHAQEKLQNRQCLLKVFSALRFLSRQCCAIRGDADENDCRESDIKLQEWMIKGRDKYLCHEAQNEMLKIMALKVLKDIGLCLHKSPFYTIMADETTDKTNKEQVTLVLRWMDDSNFEVHEEFIGLYEVESITSDSIVSVVKNTLIRLNLSLSKARGQCYDGASNMSGIRNGVATQLCKEEPRAVYTPCYGHALNLAVSDAIKGSKVMKSCLDTAYEITKLIKYSPRREAIFHALKNELSPSTCGIRVLCPTRWTVRAESLASILSNYSVLRATWDDCIAVCRDTELVARINGVSSQMNKFDFLFGLELAETVLRISDNLSKTLQHKEYSAAEGQEISSLTVKTLESIRNESSFDMLWDKIELRRQALEVDPPVIGRKRKEPQRYCSATTYPGDHFESAKHSYRQQYVEAIDLAIHCIRSRFEQPGYEVYKNLEQLITKAVTQNSFDYELKYVAEFYGDDVDKNNLAIQLNILATDYPQVRTPPSIFAIIDYFKSLSPAKKHLMDQVCTVLKLILIMPATNATSERSFSALRRLKTYLRSSMSQQRLNHLMLLHVHKERTDALDLEEAAREFIVNSEHRQRIFGAF